MRTFLLCFVFIIFFAPFSNGQSTEAKIAYNNAVTAFSGKDYAGAVSLLEVVVENEPDFIQAQRLMAESHKGLNNEEQTQKYYKEVLRIQPNQPDVWYRYAMSHSRMGNEDEAKNALGKVLEISPNHKKAKTKLAAFNAPVEYENNDLFDKGVKTPTKEERQSVTNTDIVTSKPQAAPETAAKPKANTANTVSAAVKKYSKKGVGFYNEKQFQEAAMSFDAALEQGSTSPKLYSYAARSHMHMGNTEKAIEYLKKAVAKDTDNGEYYYYLSKAFELKGMKNLEDKYASMAKTRGFADTAEIFNNQGVGYYNEGVDLYKAKRYKEAVQAYRQAIAANPNRANYHYNLGVALYAMKHMKESKESLKDAMEIDPTYPHAYKLMGDILYGETKYKKAAAYYDEAIVLGIKTYNAYLNVGYCYDKLYYYKKALQYFEMAESLNPNHLEVKFTVAMGYFKLDKISEAKSRLIKLAEIDPENTRVLNNISIICGRTGDFKQALEYAMRWIELDPNDGEAYNQAGDMLFNLGRGAEADKYKRKAKSLGVVRDRINY